VSEKVGKGTAFFSIADPAVGSHTVVISYAAQGNYSAAKSLSEKFTVKGK